MESDVPVPGPRTLPPEVSGDMASCRLKVRTGILVAAAIRSGERPAKAAISVSTPTTRMDKSREEEVRAAVLQAAAEIGRKL